MTDVIEYLDLKIKTQKTLIEVKELPYMLGNLSQIHQVFINLIGNALKFAKHKYPL